VALSGKILNEGPKARDRYIDFLKSGESDYPIALLKEAGVDMSSQQPVLSALDTFENLINELEKII